MRHSLYCYDVWSTNNNSKWTSLREADRDGGPLSFHLWRCSRVQRDEDHSILGAMKPLLKWKRHEQF